MPVQKSDAQEDSAVKGQCLLVKDFVRIQHDIILAVPYLTAVLIQLPFYGSPTLGHPPPPTRQLSRYDYLFGAAGGGRVLLTRSLYANSSAFELSFTDVLPVSAFRELLAWPSTACLSQKPREELTHSKTRR